MSELKVRHVVDVYDDYTELPCEERSQVYLKSEADKVIAEKDKEIHRLKRENEELKEATSWRMFNDEKPTEEMEGDDFLVSNGFYSVVCEWRGY